VQSEKLLNLLEREAQLLATANDAEIVEVGFRLLTIAGGAARRRAQNSAPFVEANSLDVYTGAGGKLSDPHPLIVNPILRYRLKIFELTPLSPGTARIAGARSRVRDEGRTFPA